MVIKSVTLVFCLIPTIYVAYTDWKCRIINDFITIPVTIMGIVFALVYTKDIKGALIGFTVGFGIMLLVGLIQGAGGGDIKLSGAIGVWFGVQGTICILLIGSILALAYRAIYLCIFGGLRNEINSMKKTSIGLLLKFRHGIDTTANIQDMEGESIIKDSIPLGTFIVISAWVYILINWL